MQSATYSHDLDDERFELPIGRKDVHQLEIIEVGLRVSFALAQENESSVTARPFLLAHRFDGRMER